MKKPPEPVYEGEIVTLDHYLALRKGTRLTDARGTHIETGPGIPAAWLPMKRGWL